MESSAVLMTFPMSTYLEQELQRRFNLYKLWTVPQKSQFLKDHSSSIRTVVGNSSVGADGRAHRCAAEAGDSPDMQHRGGRDHLNKCMENDIRVTNTPDVLTDDVVDLTIGLMLAVLRSPCESNRYVRSGKWKKGDFKLMTRLLATS